MIKDKSHRVRLHLMNTFGGYVKQNAIGNYSIKQNIRF